MKFKFKKNGLTGDVLGVIRTENAFGVTDNSYIPFDPDNIDYQEYLTWVAEGNTPEEAD